MSNAVLVALLLTGFVSGFVLGYTRRSSQSTRGRVADTPDTDPRGRDLGGDGGYGFIRPSADDSPDVRVEHVCGGKAEED